MNVIVDYSDTDQKFVKKTIIAKYIHPRENPDQKICPEGNNDKKQKQCLMFASCHAVTAWQGYQYCNYRRDK
jgi:hypothetical protein